MRGSTRSCPTSTSLCLRGSSRPARCLHRGRSRLYNARQTVAALSRRRPREPLAPDQREQRRRGMLTILAFPSAGVAKLADARDLKSRGRKAVWVRFPPPALQTKDLAARVATSKQAANGLWANSRLTARRSSLWSVVRRRCARDEKGRPRWAPLVSLVGGSIHIHPFRSKIARVSAIAPDNSACSCDRYSRVRATPRSRRTRFRPEYRAPLRSIAAS